MRIGCGPELDFLEHSLDEPTMHQRHFILLRCTHSYGVELLEDMMLYFSGN